MNKIKQSASNSSIKYLKDETDPEVIINELVGYIKQLVFTGTKPKEIVMNESTYKILVDYHNKTLNTNLTLNDPITIMGVYITIN